VADGVTGIVESVAGIRIDGSGLIVLVGEMVAEGVLLLQAANPIKVSSIVRRNHLGIFWVSLQI